jgi:chromate reductase, NAD(P)H dehydrogenase (quinone)
MPTILAISGSLRRKSFNTMLIQAVADALPEGTRIEIASIRDIPLYNADVDLGSGPPTPVRELKEKIVAADGLLLATPEYNHSLPGTLKNAIDWVSRPSTDIPRVFGGRPVGIVGATTGTGATILAQAAWLPVLRALGMLPYFGPRVAVTHAAKVFDAEDRIQDEVVRVQVEKYAAGFAQFVARNQPPKGTNN